MNISSLSLVQKIILSGLPFLIGSGLTLFTLVHLNRQESNIDLQRAIKMTNLVNTAELEMVRMSEALRGYLLNPNNLAELQRKKTADAHYTEQAEALEKLVSDFPDIVALNKKMADFDAKELNEIENKVGEMISKKDPHAAEFYEKNYTPARSLQENNLKELKELVYAKSKEIVNTEQGKKEKQVTLSIVILLSSLFLGLCTQAWILIKSTQKIASICKELIQFTQQLVESTQKMNEQSRLLAHSTTDQATSLDETSAAIEQMNAMVLRNSENAKKSADTSSESQGEAERGQKVMEKVIHSMSSIHESNTQIMNQVNQNNQQVGQLVSVIKEIETKTKVINDIVFQTKLLSFNASVEAARAGEHGKGFAVVAEEVGNLATMSGKASEEISSMLQESIKKVESIIAETKNNVEILISEGTQKVQNGATIAQQCSDILHAIVSNITDVSRMAGEISTASKEQAQGVSEITKAVHRLNQTTQETSTVSQATTTNAESIKQMTEAQKQAIFSLQTTLFGNKDQATSSLPQ